MTNAEARFSNSLRPMKPEGSLGRTAQDGHLDSHTAPELCTQKRPAGYSFIDCDQSYTTRFLVLPLSLVPLIFTRSGFSDDVFQGVTRI